MKQILIVLFLTLLSFKSFADSESIKIAVNQGEPQSSIGSLNPCTGVIFFASYSVPSGYYGMDVIKFYVNGILVKTTSDPNQAKLSYSLVDKTTTVYFKITYKDAYGQQYTERTSTTFSVNVRNINISQIIAGPIGVELGCQNVSYSLSSVNDNYSYSPGPTELSITWQPPSNWNQTNISNYGKNVSFTTDGSSGGTLTASLNLLCGFKETRTLAINRTMPAGPIFSSTNPL